MVVFPPFSLTCQRSTIINVPELNLSDEKQKYFFIYDVYHPNLDRKLTLYRNRNVGIEDAQSCTWLLEHFAAYPHYKGNK